MGLPLRDTKAWRETPEAMPWELRIPGEKPGSGCQSPGHRAAVSPCTSHLRCQTRATRCLVARERAWKVHTR